MRAMSMDIVVHSGLRRLLQVVPWALLMRSTYRPQN